jgi:hypothetical protein
MSDQLPQPNERTNGEQDGDHPQDSDLRVSPPLQQIGIIFLGSIALGLAFYAGGRLFNLGWMIATAWAFAFGASVAVGLAGAVAAWRDGR